MMVVFASLADVRKIWFPRCSYIMIKASISFIDDVLRDYYHERRLVRLLTSLFIVVEPTYAPTVELQSPPKIPS